MHEYVLDWVNRTRDELNIGPPLDELPKGRPCSGKECPIARAFLPAEASTVTCSTLLGLGVAVLHPDYIVSFVRRFDARDYPELIEDA